MPEFLTVDVSVSSISIPTPPVKTDTETVEMPTIGPYEFQDISYGPFRFTFPTIDIPEADIPNPSLSKSTTTEVVVFGDFVPVPDVALPFLDKDYESVEVPVVDYEFFILDPFGTDLRGGSVGIEYEEVGDEVGIPIPEPNLTIDTVTIGGQSFDLNDVVIPTLSTDFPTIGPFDLPDPTYPTNPRLAGTAAVPDPTGIDVSVAVAWGRVADFVLRPIPTDFLKDPADWALFAVLGEIQKNINVDVSGILRDVLEGFTELLLSGETKERLSELRSQE